VSTFYQIRDEKTLQLSNQARPTQQQVRQLEEFLRRLDRGVVTTGELIATLLTIREYSPPRITHLADTSMFDETALVLFVRTSDSLLTFIGSMRAQQSPVERVAEIQAAFRDADELAL